MSQPARIVGEVEYREGDGQMMTIRPGPCEVDLAADSATLSWVDGDTHGLAAIPLSDFNRYVQSKAIQLGG